MKRALLLLGLAACGASRANAVPDGQGTPDANPNGDAPIECSTSVAFSPSTPVAGPQNLVVATATIDHATSFVTPRFVVQHNGQVVMTTQVDTQGLVVSFPVADAGQYDVHFDVGDPIVCRPYDTTLQVNVAGANTQSWRLRVIPAAGSAAPPQERAVTISGGVDNDLGAVQLDPGLDVAGAVVDHGGAPLAAYLRFQPEATPDATIEAFSSAAGAYDVRVGQGKHDVLIVPAAQGYAPARIVGWTASAPQLTVPDADAIHGAVLDGGGQPIGGATVALSIAGVPATIATTDASGAWSALGHLGGAVDVTVVPPDPSGLPRLEVRGATIDLTQAVTIRYASAVATVDLTGVPVRASGAAAPGARVVFTGAIASAGTITAGGKTITAAGAVATIAHADAGGALLAAKVARAPLVAVVEPAPAVDAVVAIDTSAGAPAAITAPPQVTISGTIHDPSGGARGDVRVRLAPIGALAEGTLLVPAATTDANGHFAITAAPGGHYALAAIDLAHQYAEVDAADVTAGDVGTLALGPALQLHGVVVIAGVSGGLPDAAITLLCATCTGVDRSRAQAEGLTTSGGNFWIAAPDPGTGH